MAEHEPAGTGPASFPHDNTVSGGTAATAIAAPSTPRSPGISGREDGCAADAVLLTILDHICTRMEKVVPLGAVEGYELLQHRAREIRGAMAEYINEVARQAKEKK